MTRLCTLALAVLMLSAVVGCRGQTSTSAPVVPIRNMHDQDQEEAS